MFAINAQHLITTTIGSTINSEFQILKFTFVNVKPHEQLFFLRYTALGKGGIEKVLEYYYLHITIYSTYFISC